MNELDFDFLLQNEKEIESAYIERAKFNFLTFAQGLVISTPSGKQLFRSCMASFQLETFKALEASLYSIKQGSIPARRRFWIERTKKSSKDGDLAVDLIWLLAFTERPILIQVCACDQNQAAIVKRRMEIILINNPWLNDYIKIQSSTVKSLTSRAELVIEATDASGGSHGETPDVLVLNELVHVKKWSVMETHMNNADGTPHGIVIICTNAGIKGTKAEVWRKEALNNKRRWSVHIYEGVAPWINKEDVADAKRRDPVGTEFKRLWGGKWVSGKGDAVEDEAIDKIFTLTEPMLQREHGWIFVAGLDLGISHDHSGVAVIGINKQEERMIVAYVKGFEPTLCNDKGTPEVDLMRVEQECRRIAQVYRIEWFGYDPAAGGSFMAQRLRKAGIPMREMSFASPTNCTKMAEAFVIAVKNGKLESYEDVEGRLRRDFGKFSIVSKIPAGYKLEAVSDEYGHADVGTALIICLPKAIEYLGGFSRLLDEDDDLIDGSEEELTDEEKEELPDELKDIYDTEDQLGRQYGKRPTLKDVFKDPFYDY